MSTVVLVICCTCSWRLYLSILRGHKTTNGGPLLLRPVLSFTPVFAAFCAPLPVSNALTPAIREEKSATRRERQKLLKDILSEAFPTDIKPHKETPPETPPIMQWMHHRLLAPPACSNQLEVTYGQRSPCTQPSYRISIKRSRYLFEPHEVHVKDGLIHGSLGDAWQGLCSA